MPKLEDLELKVKQTTANTQGISKMARALKDLADSSKSLGNSYQGIKNLGESIKHINPQGAEAMAKVARAISGLKNSMQSSSAISSGLRQIGRAAVEMTNNIDVDKLTAMAQVLKDIKAAATSAKAVTAVGVAKAGDPSLGSDKAKEAAKFIAEPTVEATSRVEKFKEAMRMMGNIGAEAFRQVGKAIPKIASGLADVTKQVGSAVWDRLKSKITGLTGAVGNLAHSFARIAMYRALRTAIKAITQGFSEGISHLYQWSSIVGNQFKASMDSLATSAHYLRDSLGAMASPLIDALAPAVEFVVDKFVDLINIVNQFIATFTGASTWRRAVRTPTEYASGMDDAAKSTKKATEAQKKLNKTLMDFDEIHLITTSTTKGSNPSSPSGGSGASGIDSTHFVEEPVADWIKAIKDAIDQGDWYGAGKMLADKMNSIIDNWDARAWGEKLGEKVEKGLKFYLGFMDNFNWAKLGIKSGDFINGILSKIDPEDLGHALTAKLRAGLEFLANFSWTLDLSPLGKAFGVAFNDIFSEKTMTDLGMTISGFVNNAIGIAYNFVTTADWSQMGKGIMQGIFTAISTIEWGTAGATVGNLATGLLDAVVNAIGYLTQHAGEILNAIFDFLGGLLGAITAWIDEKLEALIPDWAKELFGTKANPEDRKDGYAGMSGSSSSNGTTTTNPEPVVQDYTINYKSNNYDTVKKQKQYLSQNISPTVIWTDTGYKKVLEHRAAFAKKITTTVTFKPVVETSANKGIKTTLLSNKQLSKLLDLRAEGGFPDVGSLFVAGEAGPEMVGNIHGKTGVASGKEVTGIADAVYATGESEAALLKEQNALLRQILAKNTNITLAPNAAAGKWVSQAQTAYARATG